MARQLVIFNQAPNYLTIGLANAFAQRFDSVTLLAGSLHEQGSTLSSNVKLHVINRWYDRPGWKKALSYAIAMFIVWILLLTRYRRHEVLFVSVPPMGYLLNLLVPNRFSMVIWDLYPDTLKITGMKQSHPIFRLWSGLNRLSFSRAFKIFTISDSLADAISAYIPKDRLAVHPIWAIFGQDSKIPPDDNCFIKEHHLGGKFIVQYSGNIGLTHNVEFLIDLAEALKDEPNLLIQIIGRGPRLPKITALVKERQLNNVQMLPFQSDEMFPHSLSAANLGVVILDEKVSRGSVPSKAFNLMGLGIPALYVSSPDSELASYAQTFGHAQCFSSRELEDAATFVASFIRDPNMQSKMSRAALKAAEHFRPTNAHLFVETYFQARASAQN
jgi:hypothetical protein